MPVHLILNQRFILALLRFQSLNSITFSLFTFGELPRHQIMNSCFWSCVLPNIRASEGDVLRCCSSITSTCCGAASHVTQTNLCCCFKRVPGSCEVTPYHMPLTHAEILQLWKYIHRKTSNYYQVCFWLTCVERPADEERERNALRRGEPALMCWWSASPEG